jgi:hypothetical protein
MVGNETAETLKRLGVTRSALVEQLWEAASKVTGPEAWDQLRELARLKADIEAIDFAIASAPRPGPDEHASILGGRG